MKILDCTLRDGGYYSYWDFNPSLIRDYLSILNTMPIEYIELGYRQPAKEEYMGEYAYLPISTIEFCKQYAPSKKLAVMLNLKDVDEEQASALVEPLNPAISLIRIATAPKAIAKAAHVAAAIKKQGFLVSVNVMYMSIWQDVPELWLNLHLLNGIADFFCMVDSYGSIYPDQILDIVSRLKQQLNMPIGFHGHDNLSLAFANTLAAIKAGCEIVDVTVMGMGRGAGNLKTELLLTYLAKMDASINLNSVVELCSLFDPLRNLYHWGTSMPYMISGVNSLPQKEIMSMLSQRRYSVSSIVRRLQNRLKPHIIKYQTLSAQKAEQPALLVGGGDSVIKHIVAIKAFLHLHPDMPICFLSAKHIRLFDGIINPRFFCMIGNEGVRVEKQMQHVTSEDRFVVSSRGETEAYVPEVLHGQTYLLEVSDGVFADTPLALAIEIAEQVSWNKHLFMVGFDGYSSSIREDVYDMMRENQELLDRYAVKFMFVSLLPTEYKNIGYGSVYFELSK